MITTANVIVLITRECERFAHGGQAVFAELITSLSDDQRSSLAERGVTRELLYAWRKGKRLPTEVQVADVAAVTGAEWAELQKEITVLRAPEERRAQIAATLNWRKR